MMSGSSSSSSSSINDVPTSTSTALMSTKTVNLEGFDQGDADPVDAQNDLLQVVPRVKITELVKMTSDVEGFKQVRVCVCVLCV